VFTHSDPPFVDWVELHNTTDQPVDVGGWFLSDNLGLLTLFRIPDGTVIPAGGYVAFDENELGFAFDSAHGDDVVLSEATGAGVMTGGRDYLAFGALENGVSYGRFPDGSEHAYRLTERTLAASNAKPRVGPIVVNEIMYHPPDLLGGVDNEDHEFIEMHNVTGESVSLSTYFPAADVTHPWRLKNAVDYTFGTATAIPGYGFLLVVSFDPISEPAKLADFRLTYGLDESTPIVGPYEGKLNNSGEPLELQSPDTPQPPGSPDEGFVPYVLVDAVPYLDSAPWPPEANGNGASLERIVPTVVGDLASNWRASVVEGGTPGAVNSCPADGDHDGDGDVDQADFTYFAECLTGVDGGHAIPRCVCFDSDADGDVDLRDFSIFTRAFTGE
jgi:hypothetical protein